MAFLIEEKFRFESEALSADTFGVVEFKGEEDLSMPYRFEILLVSSEPEIDIPTVVQMPVCFTIRRNNGADIRFHGIVSQFQQLHAVDQFVFYRAILVPRLWWLSLTHHHQVFLDQSVPEMVQAVLIDAGLTTNDFEFRLKDTYPKMAYACQYGETHFDFISRRLEHEGIYYFFEQNDGFEKIIFTDTKITETACSFDGCMLYATPTGLNQVEREEAIQNFTCCFGSLPSRVRLKDYNYRRPSVEISGRALVDENGRGEVYLYGEHFPSPEEGDRLANVRAQELFCRQQIFKGESTIPCLQPGYGFEMDDHYRDSFNRKYVTIKLSHEGSQSGYLVAGIADGLSDREKQLYYRNQFSAMPNDVQYRPLRTTARPTISGSLNGKIDAPGSGNYAELDDQGRYKVILPFDLSGRDQGRASTWLRMAQPYAGTTHGMHFPLHKDTEVLLSFIEGDPDRPVITGAVPNLETPSPVTSKDATMAKITTAGGNKIHIEDQEGKQRILYQSPTANTWMRLGAPNDPPADEGKDWEPKIKEDGFGFSTSGSADWYVGANLSVEIGGAANSIIGGLENRVVVGGKNEQVFGEEYNGVLGGGIHVYYPLELHYSPAHTRLHNRVTKINTETTRMVGEINQMIGQHTKMIGENTKMIGTTTRMVGQNTSLIGEHIESLGGANQAVGQVIQTWGESIKTIGTGTLLQGERTITCGDQTILAGSNTTMAGNQVNMAEDHTNLGLTNTTMAGQVLFV